MIRFAMPLLPQAPAPVQTYATIALSAHQSAQGPILRTYRDGRVMIDTGQGSLTGRPLAAGPVPATLWAPLFTGL